MRILFVNLQPFLPQMAGGVETSTLGLAVQLRLMGHDVAVMCTLRSKGWLSVRHGLLRRISGHAFPVDRLSGIPIYRGYGLSDGFAELNARFRPDAVIVSGGTDGTLDLAADLAKHGISIFHYFHDVTSVRRTRTLPSVVNLRYLANSCYTARTLAEAFGIRSTVIYPLVEPELYRTSSTRAHVTMINPRLIKGGDIALRLAEACPDIPFTFVEAWTADEYVEQLRNRTAALGNVRWMRTTHDMKAVYATTRILLVPSRWEETWGRVVTEAHVSGIPVLASTMAALPESVGTGGVLVEPDAPADRWHTALRGMWDDPILYDTLSRRAAECALRAEIQPSAIAEKLVAQLSGQGDAEAAELPAARAASVRA